MLVVRVVVVVVSLGFELMLVVAGFDFVAAAVVVDKVRVFAFFRVGL